jgi:hypothetical protein
MSLAFHLCLRLELSRGSAPLSGKRWFAETERHGLHYMVQARARTPRIIRSISRKVDPDVSNIRAGEPSPAETTRVLEGRAGIGPAFARVVTSALIDFGST